MSYNVIPTPTFKSQAKRLIKKFPSLKKELSDLNVILSRAPDFGTSLGNDTFKIRLAVKSKGKVAACELSHLRLIKTKRFIY